MAPLNRAAEADADIRLYWDEEELLIDDPAFVDNGRVYVPVRLMTEHWGAEAVWSPEHAQLEVTLEDQDQIVFTYGSREVVINGDVYWMDVEPLMRNNRLYVPARHVAELMHARVDWERDEQKLHFHPVPMYEVQPGETLLDISEKTGVPVDELKLRNNKDDIYVYAGDEMKIAIPKIMSEKPSEEDLELLAKIIHVEAGHEGIEGRIAVGNVVLNRVNDSRFPDTIRDVIYQPNQFPPATNGLLDAANPDELTYEAALRALQGEVVAEGALYFYNPKRTTASFFTSREVVIELGNHRFVK